jgi:hypothetical protein
MANFIATTASNGAGLKDLEAVKKILERYVFDGDLTAEIETSQSSGQPYLSIYGYEWPGAFKVPDGVNRDDFEPDYDVEPLDIFEDFLKELAPFLTEPLTIQSVGAEKCRFPLCAREWHIRPGAADVEQTGFRHSEG